jgi:hypothetical protein
MITVKEAYKIAKLKSGGSTAKLEVCYDAGSAWYFGFEGVYAQNGLLSPGSNLRGSVNKNDGRVVWYGTCDSEEDELLSNATYIPIEEILEPEYSSSRFAYA